LSRHQIEVTVVSPEEAGHGVAEFWFAGVLYGFTRLEDDDLMFHVVSGAVGQPAPVGAQALHEALLRARDLLSR
jgi:hypothetical protein